MLAAAIMALGAPAPENQRPGGRQSMARQGKAIRHALRKRRQRALRAMAARRRWREIERRRRRRAKAWRRKRASAQAPAAMRRRGYVLLDGAWVHWRFVALLGEVERWDWHE